MSYVTTKTLTREEWLAMRKHSIGASDVAVLLNLNPHKTAYQLWEEKILSSPLAEVDNDAVHFGNKLEDTVAQEYAERTGRKVIRDNKIRVHPECEFFTCNLDRIILPANGEGRGVLECKTAASYTVRSWDTEVPPMYYTQVQAQLAITGYKWGALALLVDGRSFTSFEIERDDKFAGQLLAIVSDFWTDHVMARVPPPAVVADYARMESAKDAVVEAGEDVLAAYQQLLRVRADIKQLEGNQEQLENTIKMALGTAETLASNGTILATWKTAKPSTVFDAKKFRAEHAVMAAEYETTKPGNRRLLIKGEK